MKDGVEDVGMWRWLATRCTASRRSCVTAVRLPATKHRDTQYHDDNGAGGSASRSGTKAVVCGDLYQVSLVDTPGRVDYGGEVEAALSLVDGALVVVDYMEDAGLQTDRVLRCLVQRGIRPVLFINKLDVAIATAGWDAERIAEACAEIVRTVNGSIQLASSVCDWRVWPVDGSVVFGSASGEWGFTLAQFARQFSFCLGLERSELLAPWQEEESRPSAALEVGTESGKRSHGFVDYVLGQLMEISQLCQSENWIECEQRAAAFGLTVCAGTLDTSPGAGFFHQILRHHFPIRDFVADTLVHHLPSPLESTKDCGSEHVGLESSCPLIVRVVRTLRSNDGEYIAVGRILSGRLVPGQEVLVLTSSRMPPSRIDVREPWSEVCTERKIAQVNAVGLWMNGELTGIAMAVGAPLVIQDTEMGALPTLYATTAEDEGDRVDSCGSGEVSAFVRGNGPISSGVGYWCAWTSGDRSAQARFLCW